MMPVDEIKRFFSINLKKRIMLENYENQYDIVKDLNYRWGTVSDVYNLGGNYAWNM